MNASMMSVELEYLRSFLEDELGTLPEVRLRLVLPSGTARSMDLEQDYDAESNDVHSKHGVLVRAGSREYFFPVSWVKERRNERIYGLAREVREYVER